MAERLRPWELAWQSVRTCGASFLLCLLTLALPDSQARAQVVTGAPGFAAVGRLTLGPAGFCTATLIADDLAVTAAHCLFDRQGRAHPEDAMSFDAGLRGGRSIAQRKVRAVAAHPGFRPGELPGQEDLPRPWDVALVLLDQPLRDPRLRPFTPDQPPVPGHRVQVMAYLRDLPHTTSLQSGCPVAERLEDFLVISCPVDFGASGGPVFVTRHGASRLVGIVTAKAEAGGRPVALATRLEPALEQLLELIGAQRPSP